MKNAIKLILEIMFKIYFGTLVGLALLFLLFYGIGKIYFSPLNTLSSRWDITIPKQTKVEEYYSSDHGFHGDGYRIIKLSCKMIRFADQSLTLVAQIILRGVYTTMI